MSGSTLFSIVVSPVDRAGAELHIGQPCVQIFYSDGMLHLTAADVAAFPFAVSEGGFAVHLSKRDWVLVRDEIDKVIAAMAAAEP